MNAYTSAVNGYNQAQLGYAQAGANEMGGFGSLAGTVLGAVMPKIAKGGPAIRFEDGGGVDTPDMPDPVPLVGSDPQMTPDQGGGQTGIPSAPIQPSEVPPGGTPGGGVPAYASPSMGQATDDVPAMLTANEFVIPKDVATWVGHKALAGQIDKARAEQQKFSNRGDIGGEPTQAIPQRPTFISRPQFNVGRTMGQQPIGARATG